MSSKLQVIVLLEGPVKRTKFAERGKKSRKHWVDCYMILTPTALVFYKDHKTYLATVSICNVLLLVLRSTYIRINLNYIVLWSLISATGIHVLHFSDCRKCPALLALPPARQLLELSSFFRWETPTLLSVSRTTLKGNSDVPYLKKFSTHDHELKEAVWDGH